MQRLKSTWTKTCLIFASSCINIGILPLLLLFVLFLLFQGSFCLHLLCLCCVSCVVWSFQFFMAASSPRHRRCGHWPLMTCHALGFVLFIFFVCSSSGRCLKNMVTATNARKQDTRDCRQLVCVGEWWSASLFFVQVLDAR